MQHSLIVALTETLTICCRSTMHSSQAGGGSSLKTFKLKAPLQCLRKDNEGVNRHVSPQAGTTRFAEMEVMMVLGKTVMDNLSHDTPADPLAGKLTWLKPSSVHGHLVSPKTAWQVHVFRCKTGRWSISAQYCQLRLLLAGRGMIVHVACVLS